jgi:hypothetical protein
MIKYQKRKSKENWMTVETSNNDSPNMVSNVLDRLERTYPGCSCRAVNDKNQLLEMR